MAAEICGIVLALLAAQPEYGRPPSKAWLDPKVASAGLLPDRAELLRDHPQAARQWASLFRKSARKLPAADCTGAFVGVGYRLAPWPVNKIEGQLDMTPDGNPALTFNSVTLSRDGRFALLAWLAYSGSINASFRYAVLEKSSSGWRIAGSGTFGPVS